MFELISRVCGRRQMGSDRRKGGEEVFLILSRKGERSILGRERKWALQNVGERMGSVLSGPGEVWE